MCPPQTIRVSWWDLNLVLEYLTVPPFKPMEHSDLKWLLLKTVFLLAITLAKRVGELHAVSVSTSCICWNVGGTGVTLWLFSPKRSLFCLETRLLVYTLQSQIHKIRWSDQLFLCSQEPRTGQAEIVTLGGGGYHPSTKSNGCPLPPGVKCHSTKIISTFWTALKGALLSDIAWQLRGHPWRHFHVTTGFM